VRENQVIMNVAQLWASGRITNSATKFNSYYSLFG